MKVFLNPGHAPGGHPDPGLSMKKRAFVNVMWLWPWVNLLQAT